MMQQSIVVALLILPILLSTNGTRAQYVLPTFWLKFSHLLITLMNILGVY